MNTEGRFFCVDKTMKNELNQGMKGVLSHSGEGSCCANFTMNASDQNTEEPSPCVNTSLKKFTMVKKVIMIECIPLKEEQWQYA